MIQSHGRVRKVNPPDQPSRLISHDCLSRVARPCRTFFESRSSTQEESQGTAWPTALNPEPCTRGVQRACLASHQKGVPCKSSEARTSMHISTVMNHYPNAHVDQPPFVSQGHYGPRCHEAPNHRRVTGCHHPRQQPCYPHACKLAYDVDCRRHPVLKRQKNSRKE